MVKHVALKETDTSLNKSIINNKEDLYSITLSRQETEEKDFTKATLKKLNFSANVTLNTKQRNLDNIFTPN